MNTARSLTVASGATGAVISVEGAPVRWRGDGTAPTSAIGHLMAVGTWIVSQHDIDLRTAQFTPRSSSRNRLEAEKAERIEIRENQS